jgi:tetratricopeptide (TPR) repeat protein
VDTRTRHALKKDKFAQAAASSASWVTKHRSGVRRWTISAVAVLVLLVGVVVYWNVTTSAADRALGAAMDVYSAPLAEPGQPALNGEYQTAKERTQAANKQFLAVAEKYGWLPEGVKARYFAGVTYEDMGDNSAAQSELERVANAWDWGNRNVSSLAKMALAGLFEQTGRDSQAEAIYKALAAKPTETVPATRAQLALADLYSSQGKQKLAQGLWAKVQDADKDGEAGAIAAQKLKGGQ